MAEDREKYETIATEFIERLNGDDYSGAKRLFELNPALIGALRVWDIYRTIGKIKRKAPDFYKEFAHMVNRNLEDLMEQLK